MSWHGLLRFIWCGVLSFLNLHFDGSCQSWSIFSHFFRVLLLSHPLLPLWPGLLQALGLCPFIFTLFILKMFRIDFWREGKGEGERHIDVRVKPGWVASWTPPGHRHSLLSRSQQHSVCLSWNPLLPLRSLFILVLPSPIFLFSSVLFALTYTGTCGLSHHPSLPAFWPKPYLAQALLSNSYHFNGLNWSHNLYSHPSLPLRYTSQSF